MNAQQEMRRQTNMSGKLKMCVCVQGEASVGGGGGAEPSLCVFLH